MSVIQCSTELAHSCTRCCSSWPGGHPCSTFPASRNCRIFEALHASAVSHMPNLQNPDAFSRETPRLKTRRVNVSEDLALERKCCATRVTWDRRISVTGQPGDWCCWTTSGTSLKSPNEDDALTDFCLKLT